MIRTLNKLRTEGTYLNIVKATIYDKPTSNTIHDGERLKAIALRSGKKTSVPIINNPL